MGPSQIIAAYECIICTGFYNILKIMQVLLFLTDISIMNIYSSCYSTELSCEAAYIYEVVYNLFLSLNYLYAL